MRIRALMLVLPGACALGFARRRVARAVVNPQDLNLGYYDPQIAAEEAACAVKRGKRHLLALEIGNDCCSVFIKFSHQPEWLWFFSPQTLLVKLSMQTES